MFNIVRQASTVEEEGKGNKGEGSSVSFEYFQTDSHSASLLKDLSSCWAVGWELAYLYPTGEKRDEVTGRMVQTYDLMLRRPKAS